MFFNNTCSCSPLSFCQLSTYRILPFYTPENEVEGVWELLCLFVCLPVCLCRFVSGPKLLICFDIGLPYLAYWCITMRRCVAYIHDPNTTLTFDLNVKFIRFLTSASQARTFFVALTFTYHIWHMIQDVVAYIRDLDTTMTFEFKVRFIGFFTRICVLATSFMFLS